MDICTTVAKMRLKYHANMCSVNNVLNQLNIVSDERAERNNKKHVMTIVNDILPRIYGQKAVDKLFENEES